MNRIAGLLLLAFAVITAIGCTKVEPGFAGIKVNQYGSQRGVQDFPIETGRVWYNPFTEDVYAFPTFRQNHTWSKDAHEGSNHDQSITFQSSEGASLNVDIGISYRFVFEKVPHLFVEFKQDADHIRDVFMRNQVRDAFNELAGRMPAMEIVGVKKGDLLASVTEKLNHDLNRVGIMVESVSWNGEARMDQRIHDSINAVIESMQNAIKAKNMILQKEAEAKQVVATAEGNAKSIVLKAQADADSVLIAAKAQAEANRLQAESLNANLLQWNALNKWDGKLPQITSGGTVPFVQFDNKK
jgi:regulator of protease activity HflC (stomatin/prohibitin superfamily)